VTFRLRHRWSMSERFRKLNELFRKRVRVALQASSIYLVAALPPLAVSAWWLWSVSPLWFGTDSTSMLLWPIYNIPHFPPLYMITLHFAERTIGTTPIMLKALMIFQHLLLIGSIVYLASSLATKLSALLLSMFATLGPWLGAFSHVVATQAFEIPLLAVLIGILLRCYANGWSRPLLRVFVPAAIGLALTRHASIVFTIMLPLYWGILGLMALFKREPVRQYIWASAISVAVVLATLVVSSVATDLACRNFKKQRGTSDCTRIYGRAGMHRMIATLTRVPAAEREKWLTEKMEGLLPESAFAFRTMATDGSPWLGAYVAIREKYPDQNVDRLMNTAFFHFLASPDRYSLAQMTSELRTGLSLGVRYAPLSGIFAISASTLTSEGHREMRVKLGARADTDSPQHRELSATSLVGIYDAYTTGWLNIIALVMYLLAIVITRKAEVLALGLAVILSAATYVFLVSGVIVMVTAYVLPVHFLMYILTGISMCVVLQHKLNSGHAKAALI
jgi:hypothetical protein